MSEEMIVTLLPRVSASHSPCDVGVGNFASETRKVPNAELPKTRSYSWLICRTISAASRSVKFHSPDMISLMELRPEPPSRSRKCLPTTNTDSDDAPVNHPSAAVKPGKGVTESSGSLSTDKLQPSGILRFKFAQS